ncbi:MAG: P-II family nitrogen regulator [Pseudomonadota bacterium]
MNPRRIVHLTDVSLITCIVQRGVGDIVAQAAQDAGAQGATIYYARGTGVRQRLGALGVTVDAEKEVVNIIVATSQQEAVFDAIYLAGELDTPGMGIAFITPLEKAATYIPPEVLDRRQES